jgi:hypothetical protein
VYNCDSGQTFLQQLNEEQLNSIMSYVDPDYWQNRFADLADDVIFARRILKLTGL